MSQIKSGIYKIINLINNKIYVGSAVKLTSRKYSHFFQLERNFHKNLLLQNSYNKYGKSNFIFEVIEYIEDRTKLIEKEQYYLDLYKSYNKKNGFNICPTAGSLLGYKQSEETKLKRANSNRGKKRSIESKLRMSKSKLGIKMSDESKLKISKSKKGQKYNRLHLKIINIKTGIIHITHNLEECLNILNISKSKRTSIYNVINGIRHNINGFTIQKIIN